MDSLPTEASALILNNIPLIFDVFQYIFANVCKPWQSCLTKYLESSKPVPYFNIDDLLQSWSHSSLTDDFLMLLSKFDIIVHAHFIRATITDKTSFIDDLPKKWLAKYVENDNLAVSRTTMFDFFVRSVKLKHWRVAHRFYDLYYGRNQYVSQKLSSFTILAVLTCREIINIDYLYGSAIASGNLVVFELCLKICVENPDITNNILDNSDMCANFARNKNFDLLKISRHYNCTCDDRVNDYIKYGSKCYNLLFKIKSSVDDSRDDIRNEMLNWLDDNGMKSNDNYYCNLIFGYDHCVVDNRVIVWRFDSTNQKTIYYDVWTEGKQLKQLVNGQHKNPLINTGYLLQVKEVEPMATEFISTIRTCVSENVDYFIKNTKNYHVVLARLCNKTQQEFEVLVKKHGDHIVDDVIVDVLKSKITSTD